MEIYLKKHRGSLVPSLPEDEDKLTKWKFGEVLKVTITKPRNSQFHRKFFALINVAFYNQEKYTNIEDFLTEIKLKIGHYQEHITTKGVVVYMPKSISFANVDEMTFQIIYDKTVRVIINDFMPTTPAELEKMTNELLGF